MIMLTLIAAALVACARHLWTRHTEAANAANARAAREVRYAVAATSLQQVILPGMHRREVESILQSRSLPFELRSGAGTHDEIVPLGHEPSPRWACNWEQVQLLITFAPAVSSPAPTAKPNSNSSGFSQASPDDRVKSLALDHWLRDCI